MFLTAGCVCRRKVGITGDSSASSPAATWKLEEGGLEEDDDSNCCCPSGSSCGRA